HVTALDPLLLTALGGRSRPRDRAGNHLCLWGPAHPGGLALRNAGARRAAIGADPHSARGDPCIWRPCPPHAGSGTYRRPDRRQLQRRPLLGLDEHRAWRERDVVRHPLGARTVEPAAGPARKDLANEHATLPAPPHVGQPLTTLSGGEQRRGSMKMI